MEFFQSIPRDKNRENAAFRFRIDASLLARDGKFSGDNGHTWNGDEQRFANSLIGSFTKGLPHNKDSSLIDDISDFDAFVDAINTGDVLKIKQLPLGPVKGESFTSSMAKGTKRRGWESMAAGLAFNIEGPDPQRVTMPPAPQIDSLEESFELSEVYWMALLRDVPFSAFKSNSGNGLLKDAVQSLNRHPWVNIPTENGSSGHQQCQNIRKQINLGNLFRGTTTGDCVGPYLSQFLLIGNDGLGGFRLPSDGEIEYGSITIDQRIRKATEKRDYMTSWQSFIDVQNAADVRGFESYDNESRFITTPRDLATYVHYDALYEAYLNACLIMLAMRIPFDEGLPFRKDDEHDKQTGFALFGGPHILSLVTEVATRALKAVRYQKFNIHRRPRPEAVAGLVDVYKRAGSKDESAFAPIGKLVKNMDHDLLKKIADHNLDQNKNQDDKNGPRGNDRDPVTGNSFNAPTYLLPMAFPEGSPMHPAYGAGHATVAGACVTILKAFFKADEELPHAYEPSEDGSCLVPCYLEKPLTVEGELNKLCSNISIGRDWAGVHWFSDYRESINMGEEIAIQILREQKLSFVENVTMTVPLFNGKKITI